MARRSLQDVCLELRDKVDTFLAQEASTPQLKQVQQQVRVSMAVVDTALARYECAFSFPRFPGPCPPAIGCQVRLSYT